MKCSAKTKITKKPYKNSASYTYNGQNYCNVHTPSKNAQYKISTSSYTPSSSTTSSSSSSKIPQYNCLQIWEPSKWKCDGNVPAVGQRGMVFFGRYDGKDMVLKWMNTTDGMVELGVTSSLISRLQGKKILKNMCNCVIHISNINKN
jgi:hypothetical protein